MGIIGLLLFILTGQGRQEISALGTLKLEGDKKAVALAGLVVSWTLVPVQQRVPDGRRASSWAAVHSSDCNPHCRRYRSRSSGGLLPD